MDRHGTVDGGRDISSMNQGGQGRRRVPSGEGPGNNGTKASLLLASGRMIPGFFVVRRHRCVRKPTREGGHRIRQRRKEGSATRRRQPLHAVAHRKSVATSPPSSRTRISRTTSSGSVVGGGGGSAISMDRSCMLISCHKLGSIEDIYVSMMDAFRSLGFLSQIRTASVG